MKLTDFTFDLPEELIAQKQEMYGEYKKYQNVLSEPIDSDDDIMDVNI